MRLIRLSIVLGGLGARGHVTHSQLTARLLSRELVQYEHFFEIQSATEALQPGDTAGVRSRLIEADVFTALFVAPGLLRLFSYVGVVQG